jgi:predicted glutamine amidotransferase
MCLAIYKPATTTPDWSAYRNGFAVNDDSWGFAVVVDGTLVTRCGIGPFEEFREAFSPYADRQAIIHFRWATHGKKDTGNCHPFMVSDALAVIHNGVISIQCDVDKDRSDTWHFNELVLKPLHSRDEDFYRRREVVYTQQLAHSGSKFVFLRADGDYSIWNEDDGDWSRDGHWYSNDSHEGSYYRSIGYGLTSRTTTTATKTERSWIEASDGKWKYVEEDTAASACRTAYDRMADEQEEEDREDSFYTNMRVEDLLAYGFSRKCLAEVQDMLGHLGIEALHDAL